MIRTTLRLTGFVFIVYSIVLFYQHYNPNRIAFASYQTEKITACKDTQSLPKRIRIPSIKVDLPVIAQSIIKGTWETTTQGVSYLISSPTPGVTGNSILYGHNWTSLLGNLPRVKPGNIIEVQLANNNVKVFRVTGTSIVDPTDTHILDNSSDTRITVYTCTGFLDSKRFVVTATLIN